MPIYWKSSLLSESSVIPTLNVCTSPSKNNFTYYEHNLGVIVTLRYFVSMTEVIDVVAVLFVYAFVYFITYISCNPINMIKLIYCYMCVLTHEIKLIVRTTISLSLVTSYAVQRTKF